MCDGWILNSISSHSCAFPKTKKNISGVETIPSSEQGTRLFVTSLTGLVRSEPQTPSHLQNGRKQATW